MIVKTWKYLLVISLFLLAPFLYAQEHETGLLAEESLPELPQEVRQIREEQLSLSRQGNAEVQAIETPGVSRTRIHNIPDIIQGRVINNASDAVDAVRELYPYYGFRGTESLRLENERKSGLGINYTFRQYIDGMKTAQTIRMLVDEKALRIVRLSGSAILDRDYSRLPEMSEEAAIEAAMERANEKEAAMVEGGGELIYYLDGSRIHTDIEYIRWGENRIPEPVWNVYIPFRNPPANSDLTHEKFQVNPNGEVVDFDCSGQLIPDSSLGFFSALAGGTPPLY